MLFHIYVTYYGSIDYLKQGVESVIAQSDEDWNLTILDDCFPGNAAEIYIRSLNDTRIRYLRNARNLGVSQSFNLCVSLCDAEYLMIMGHDDSLAQNFVARAKALIRAHPGVDLFQSGVMVMDEHGADSSSLADFVKRKISETLPSSVALSGLPVLRSLMVGNWTYFPSIVWRKSTLSQYEFRSDLPICQDLYMLCTILANGGSLLKDDVYSFRYRRHSVSLSSKAARSGDIFHQERIMYRDLASMFSEHGVPGAVRWAKAHPTSRLSALVISIRALLEGNFRALSKALRYAIS